MGIALRELVRRPRRFASVGVALTLLTVLLVVLGGFLDGLELSQTGAYRAHDDVVLVFGDDADRQIQRSEVTDEQADAVASAPAVAEVGALEQTFTVAGIDGDLEDVGLWGYDLGTSTLPDPPPPGEAVVDAQLRRLTGVDEGDTIELGPDAVPVTVAAVVDDLTQGAPTVWLSSAEWRRVVGEANPSALPAPGTRPVLVARPADGDVGATADALAAVDGVDAVSASEAVAALDVVQQQSSTFRGIIIVTFVICLIVVALFFALITLERVRLYAVLKALGARTGELVGGVAAQAAAVSVVALVVGGLISLGFVELLPPDLPVRVQPVRLAQIAAGTVVVAVLGSLFTVRRLVRIDPAEVIG